MLVPHLSPVQAYPGIVNMIKNPYLSLKNEVLK
jgi:hypothetical protein